MNKAVFHGFANRSDAGRLLAERLVSFVKVGKPVLLALPRGGVPVAAAMAKALGLFFDLLIVRKLGVPGHEEYAMGAIATGGVMVLDHRVVAQMGIQLDEVERVIHRERHELERREELYRANRPPPEVVGRTVIVVDDGIATGSTMSAAIELLRKLRAGRIVVAVPVAPHGTVRRLRREADDVIVLCKPTEFIAVGRWYEDFFQTSDEDVRRLMAGQESWMAALG